MRMNIKPDTSGYKILGMINEWLKDMPRFGSQVPSTIFVGHLVFTKLQEANPNLSDPVTLYKTNPMVFYGDRLPYEDELISKTEIKLSHDLKPNEIHIPGIDGIDRAIMRLGK